MRSATGGSLPALTSSASDGASLKPLGTCAGSVTTAGPSNFPIRELPPLEAGVPAVVGHGDSKIAKAMMSQGNVRTIFRSCRVLSIPRPPDLARPPIPLSRTLPHGCHATLSWYGGAIGLPQALSLPLPEIRLRQVVTR